MDEGIMSVENFKEQLGRNPAEIDFSHTMAVVDKNYAFTPVAFKNGELENKAGENNGSCKIFYFGQLQGLSKEQTLNCFGEHYRSVLQDPEGDGHQNIRNFMRTGWAGIEFQDKALQPK
jgi:hypothetical protein